MIEIGTLYAGILKYPHRNVLPIVEKGWTNEIDEPFRLGSCLVFRIPFTKPGLIIGIWKHPQDENDALSQALSARVLDTSLDELMEWK